MTYYDPPLVLEPTRLHDALGVIDLSDLPDPEPSNRARLRNATPLIERLWRIALSDVESNIVRLPDGSTYFGAGAGFGAMVYTRDISYSGVLSLNRLYPEIMRRSLEHTRRVRLKLGLRVSRAYKVEGIEADWVVEDISEDEFLTKYLTNSYTRRTDDVVWLWCAGDLLERYGSPDDWNWLYETGKECFQRLYDPFFDPEDGLYRGQASFIDIHFEDTKATGYPSEWGIADCVRIKATSTNCLYAKGLEVMSVAAGKLGLADQAELWASRARSLKQAIRRELRFEDGTFAYFKHMNGRLEDRRDALGTALAVLLDVVAGEEAVQALRDYPVTDAGVPLFHPFYPADNWYHNNSSWPFVDTLFLMAWEKADGKDRTSLNLALLARVCRDGSWVICRCRRRLQSPIIGVWRRLLPGSGIDGSLDLTFSSSLPRNVFEGKVPQGGLDDYYRERFTSCVCRDDRSISRTPLDNMDPVRLKRELGDELTFEGGVDVEHILPFGTVDEVREHAKRVIDILAPGGGFMFKVQAISRLIPYENIVAAYEVALEYGRYGKP